MTGGTYRIGAVVLDLGHLSADDLRRLSAAIASEPRRRVAEQHATTPTDPPDTD